MNGIIMAVIIKTSKSSTFTKMNALSNVSIAISAADSHKNEEPTKPPVNFFISESVTSLNKNDILESEDFSTLVRNIIPCTLIECMNELAMLRSINLQNDLGPESQKLITYVSIEDRYMGGENHSEYRINSTNSSFDKLAKDINMVYVTLLETCRDILIYEKYKRLQDVIKSIARMHEEEETLLESAGNSQRIIEDTKNRYEAERLDNIRTIEETDAKIQNIRFKAEDFNIYGQLEVQYFERWEKTRMEQNTMKCEEKENYYRSIIKGTEEQILTENRCHAELGKYFDEMRNDYLEEIQQWMKKYDDETDQREGDTLTLRSELEKIGEEKKVAMEKYEKRQAEIDDWLRYKQVKEEKEMQRQKEIWCAVRIQAWWRGVLVRKKLGPYKPKKKGKKDQKKKK